MAGAQSMASILPLIRCSDCGVDVELSMMGEHVCSKQSECKVPGLTLGPHTNTGMKVAPFPQLSIAQVPSKSSLETAFDRPVASKAARAPPPPRLQTNAIGAQRKSGHGPMGTDNRQVGHWYYQMSLRLPAVAEVPMPYPL
jgi:hypothetical protein